MTSRKHLRDSMRILKASPLADARLMLVDSDPDRVAFTRRWIETEGGPEAEVVATGDEALDVIGAKSQRFDIVTIWPWLADDRAVDLVGVLRRCKSPMRLVAVTSATPAELGRCGRLAGVAAVESSGQPNNLLVVLGDVLARQDSVGDIVAQRRVPPTLSNEWARAIYGTASGQRFHAPLD